MKWWLYIPAILFMAAPEMSAAMAVNDKVSGFDRERWEALREGVDYSEQSPKLEETENEPGSRFLAPLAIKLLRYAGIAVLVIGLVLLILRMLGAIRFTRAKRPPPIQNPGNDEAIPAPTSIATLEAALMAAVQNGNYREAIRIYHQLCLKQIINAGLVSYGRDKTNGEYLSEIGDRGLATYFRQLTALFEITWFGEAPADAAAFALGKQQYSKLIEKLSHARA